MDINDFVGVSVTDAKKQLTFLVNGGRVKRYHTMTTLKEQSVGHHSYGVAWLCYLLVEGSGYVLEARLLIAALAHDLAEQVTGDMPSPTKRHLDIVDALDVMEQAVVTGNLGLESGPEENLAGWERRILRMADVMEGMLNCAHERALGNRYAEQAYGRFRSYVLTLKPVEREMTLLAGIESIWEDAVGRT